MAYIGKTECHQCGREVDAHENKTGLGYYNCGPCGFRGLQRTAKGQRLFLAKVRRDASDETPESGGGNSRDFQEIPAASEPSMADAMRRQKENTPAATPAKKSSLFFGL